MNQLPVVGEYVSVEYLEIDEVGVICWLSDYGILGHMENKDGALKLNKQGKKGHAYVHYIFESNKSSKNV